MFYQVTERSNLTSATLKVSAYIDFTDTIKVRMYGYDGANPTGFTTYEDFISRDSVKTSAYNDYNITYAWTDSAYYGFDVTDIIEELFNNRAYASSNLQINIDDNGSDSYSYRTFDADDRNRNATMLILAYGSNPTFPTLTNLSTSNVTDSSARFNVTVNPQASSADLYFNIKKNGGSTYDEYNVGEYTSTTTTYYDIDTLSSGSIYNYYFSSTNEYGTTNSTVTNVTTNSGSITYDTLSVTQSSDDAYYQSAGTMNNAIVFVRIGKPTANTSTAGFRFTGVTEQASLESAILELPAYASTGYGISITIYAEDTSSTVTFPSGDASDYQSRILNSTTATLDTTIATNDMWTEEEYYGFDITDIINELFTSYSYSDGSIVIFIKDNGSSDYSVRTIDSYDNGRNVARIRLQYGN